jgi:hypothetical protein
MKRPVLLGLSCILVSVMIASAAEGPIANAMKKYHKGDTALCTKVKKGKATPAELAEILKSYEAMAGAKPEKGTAESWKQKCDALIAAVKEIQAKNPKGQSDYANAVTCKNCHEAHREKKQ